jgi:trimeric autotransporter adhesin
MKPIIKGRLRKFVLAIGAAGLLMQPLSGRSYFDFGTTAQAAQFLPSPAIEGTVFAVTAGNNLISFNQFAPGVLLSGPTAVTGLPAGENITGIDFRPRTGVLYAVTDASTLYTIAIGVTGGVQTATATAVGAAFTPAVTGSVGFDFNPAVDRIRVVTDADQNLRLNPDTGAVVVTPAPDTALAYVAGDAQVGTNPNVVASAYTNNFSGASSTSLYGIDSGTDTLVLQGSLGGTPNSPNLGGLTTVGALGVATGDQVGFDIVNPSGLALASLTAVDGTSTLYSINLGTGAATAIGQIGPTAATTVVDIAAVVPVETIFAVDSANTLRQINSGTPGTAAITTPLTGLGTGENIVGIDFRPATGQLYGVSSLSKVYLINTTTGAVSPVGSIALSPALNGAGFGVDFNPVPDLIRLTSDLAQNLRVNPTTGVVAGVDGTLAYNTVAPADTNAGTAPSIVASAYTNNVAGATATTLYGIDSKLGVLATQGTAAGVTPAVSPNTGTLFTIGSLALPAGTTLTTDIGFDIAPRTGAAFASLTPTGTTSGSQLYTINLTTGAASLIGSFGGSATIKDIAVAPRVEIVYASTATNKIVTFAATAPGKILSTVAVTGLAMGENLVGIDFRPANQTLFAVTSASNIYTINPVSGAATKVGATLTPALNGASFGVDFNPQVDRLRIVSNATQNLRVNPADGTVVGGVADGALAFAAGDANAGATPNVVGAAYTNNFAGTVATTLYDIDSTLDALVIQNPPNDGTLNTVGALGVNTSDQVGFDIADETNNAFASLQVGMGATGFYSINLQTGAATLIAAIGTTEAVTDISVGNLGPTSAQMANAAGANAASFALNAVAPGSIAAIFGNFATTGGANASAAATPLPTTLGGVSVMINGTAAGLFFASPSQINMLVPANTPNGAATVVVTSADASTDVATLTVQAVAPGVFTFNSNGIGTPAAVATPDGITFVAAFNPDGTPNPLSAGTAAAPNFLVLFTTGLQGAGTAATVTVTIGGMPATVTFAGPAPGLLGVEQINAVIPPALAGSTAALPVVVTATPTGGTALTSNTTTIRVQ